MDKNKGSLNLPEKDLPVPPEVKDFRSSMQWRIFRIMAEFIEGFEFVADLKKSVTIFGSTQHTSPAAKKWYEEARKLGNMLAKKGFSVVTGGGPGIMEAANHGAAEAGGDSIGVNIQLPMEQRINPYVNHGKGFHYFFIRKLMLTYSAQAYVYFPGGFGTLDEFFEIVTLIQTRKVPTGIPVILIGKEYWGPFNRWIEEEVYKHHGAIDSEDRNIYKIVDSAEEAMKIILKSKPRDNF